MNLRRCFCCLLSCVFCFSAVSLTSVCATDVDGYNVVTAYALDDNYYTDFTTTVSIESVSETLYIKATIYFPELLVSGTVFDLVLDLDYTANTSIEAVCNLYSVNNQFLSTETPSISVVNNDATGGTDKQLRLYDILVANGDLSYMEIYFTIDDPYFFENTIYETYTFKINGTSYSCTEGYTWEVFVESSNNDGTIYIDDSGYVCSTLSSSYLYCGGVKVLGTDYVQNSANYWLTTDGSVYDVQKSFTFYYLDTDGNSWNKVFYYDEGMTWAEWIASDYVTDNFYVVSSGNITYRKFDNSGYLTVCDSSKAIINASSGVISEAVYGTYNYWMSSSTSSLAVTDYRYFFSVTGVTVSIDEGDELLGGIIGWIKNVFNSIIDLPGKIAGHLKGFFDGVANAITNLGDYLLDGIKGLFVPDADELSEYKDKWEQLLKDRFGAVYESVALIDAWANAFMNTPAQIPSTGGAGGNSEQLAQEGQIWFPCLTVNLAGSEFTFGGYAVDIIPSGFSGVVDTLKLIVNICASFLFVNALRKRLEGVLH